MKGHYVINCNNKQNGKARVCKNYFSKKHKSHRKKWAEKHGKYQKKKIITSDVPQHIVVAPPATGAKIKKRITPTLISGAAPEQPQVFGGATGQQTFQKALNRIESHAKSTYNMGDTAPDAGFKAKAHKKSYGTGRMRYDPKTGLVAPRRTSKKFQHEYM